jgi:hypothetical protein
LKDKRTDCSSDQWLGAQQFLWANLVISWFKSVYIWRPEIATKGWQSECKNIQRVSLMLPTRTVGSNGWLKSGVRYKPESWTLEGDFYKSPVTWRRPKFVYTKDGKHQVESDHQGSANACKWQSLG